MLVSLCVSVLVSMCVRACERANLQAPCWLQELSQRVVSLASAIHSGATVSPLQTGRGNSVEQTTDRVGYRLVGLSVKDDPNVLRHTHRHG